jgi:Lon protease-like protein
MAECPVWTLNPFQMNDYLPLFPLDVVLFPETLLPLHIFEERYKKMIGECIQNRSLFGIVYAHGETVEEIGCSAEVTKVLKRYPDGRMDIVVVGRQRFRVLLLDNQKAYLRAAVDRFGDDAANLEPSEEKAHRALDLYDQAFRLMQRSDPEEISQETYEGLSFKIASVLYLNNSVKQQILTSRSEDERLDILCDHLSALIPRLNQAIDAAKRANSNGNLKTE